MQSNDFGLGLHIDIIRRPAFWRPPFFSTFLPSLPFYPLPFHPPSFNIFPTLSTPPFPFLFLEPFCHLPSPQLLPYLAPHLPPHLPHTYPHTLFSTFVHIFSIFPSVFSSTFFSTFPLPQFPFNFFTPSLQSVFI